MEEAGEATLEMAQEETPPAKARAATAEAVNSAALPSFRVVFSPPNLGSYRPLVGGLFRSLEIWVVSRKVTEREYSITW